MMEIIGSIDYEISTFVRAVSVISDHPIYLPIATSSLTK